MQSQPRDVPAYVPCVEPMFDAIQEFPNMHDLINVYEFSVPYSMES
jgi:hypothetical protein